MKNLLENFLEKVYILEKTYKEEKKLMKRTLLLEDL